MFLILLGALPSHAWENPFNRFPVDSKNATRTEEPEYNITLGSLFGIYVEPGIDPIEEFTSKPSIYITYNVGTFLEPKMKKKRIKIITKDDHYPNGKLEFPCQLLVCEWTKKLSPGAYTLWVKPKNSGTKYEPSKVSGNFKLRAPVIESVTQVTGDNAKRLYVELKGKYFSLKPVINIFLSKPGKNGVIKKVRKRCKMQSVDIDRITGASVGTYSCKLPKNKSYTLMTGNGDPLVQMTNRIATSTSGIFGSELFNDIEFPYLAHYCSPAFADIDGDGDQDMILGTIVGDTDMTQTTNDPDEFIYNSFPYYYENTGTAAIPVFTRRIGADNPFYNCKGSFHIKPTFGDLDGDGDIDLVYYNMKWYPRYQMVEYFENVGDKTTPRFEPRQGDDNPFGQLTFLHMTMSAELVDMNGDGDLDLTTCNHREVRYYENIGTAQSPNFVDSTKSDSDPFRSVTLGSVYYNTHAIADVDGDGDPDLVSGRVYGQDFDFYLNVGTPQNPVFEKQVGTSNPLRGFKVDSQWPHPAFGDLDGDGDPDLISGEFKPALHCWLNRTNEIVVDFVLPPSYEVNINPGDYSTPTFGDLDGDGDLDIISGCVDGDFKIYNNLGSTTAPAFALKTADSPLSGFDVGLCSAPWLADLDGDGDLDILAGNLDGAIAYYQNIGSTTIAVFEQRVNVDNPFSAIQVDFGSNPRMADMDGDGDLDLIVADGFSCFSYYRNDGDLNSPVFTDVSGTAADPFAAYEAETGYSQVIPTLADFDKDGDLDMILVNNNKFRFFNNIGTVQGAVFKEHTGSTNPLNAFTANNYASPVFADIHGDGASVLVIGCEEGQLQQIDLVNSVAEGILFQ
jgi:VCBS repeat protein